MGLHARTKKERYRLSDRWDSSRKWRWPKGHPPKNVRHQSGRSVVVVNSGIFAVTAKKIGTSYDRCVGELTGHHMRKHRVPEELHGVYSFPSKRAMCRWLLTYHHQGTWWPRWRDFRIEWL